MAGDNWPLGGGRVLSTFWPFDGFRSDQQEDKEARRWAKVSFRPSRGGLGEAPVPRANSRAELGAECDLA